jgi:nicotinamide-nucleotide amidase
MASKLLSNSELLTPALIGLLADLLHEKHIMMTAAESCTGGMVAAACTDLAGSSTWFERGFITYSNAAKTDMLGVNPALIAQHGAVSEPVARAMAAGAITHSRAQASLAVTGVAGPGGGSSEKPLGTVWFAWSVGGVVHSQCKHFNGDRALVRAAAVQYALDRLLGLLQTGTKN